MNKHTKMVLIKIHMNCVLRHQLRVMDIELNIFKVQCPHSSDEDNNTQLCPAVGRSFTNKDLATTALPFSCASTRKIIKVGLMVCHKEVSVQDPHSSTLSQVFEIS